MAYVYINRESGGHDIVMDQPLDDNYAQGATYDEYINGNPSPWILLSEEQLMFREAHPEATVREVIEMRMDERELISKARDRKIHEASMIRKEAQRFYLDETDIYVYQGDRERISMEGLSSGVYTISGRDYDAYEGKTLLGMMDVYDKDINAAYGAVMTAIGEAGTVEGIEGVVVDEGWPTPPSLTTLSLAKEAKVKREADPMYQAISFSRMAVNSKAMALSSKQALSLKALFPIWGEEGAEFGKSVEAGFRLRTVKGDTDILYEAISDHTLSVEWEPGLSTASLYKVVEVDHEGILSDPIPYFPPMELFKDKYYIHNADIYKCIRDSGIPLSHDLEDLVGQYVEAVQV